MINICRPHNFRRHNSWVSNTLRLLNLSNTIKMFSESCQIYAKHMGLYIQYVAFLVKLLLLILTPSLNIWRTQICVVMTFSHLFEFWQPHFLHNMFSIFTAVAFQRQWDWQERPSSVLEAVHISYSIVIVCHIVCIVLPHHWKLFFVVISWRTFSLIAPHPPQSIPK